MSTSSSSFTSDSDYSSSTLSSTSLLTQLYQSLNINKPHHHHIICLGTNESNLSSIRNIFDNLTISSIPSSSTNSLPTSSTAGSVYSSLSSPTNIYSINNTISYLSYSYQNYDQIYQKAVEYGFLTPDKDKLIYQNNNQQQNRVHFYGLNIDRCDHTHIIELLKNKSTLHSTHMINSYTIIINIDSTKPLYINDQLLLLQNYRNTLLQQLQTSLSSLFSSSSLESCVSCMYLLSSSEQLIDDGSLDIFYQQLKTTSNSTTAASLSSSLITYLLSNQCRILGISTYSTYLYWYIRCQALLDNLYHPLLKTKVGFACLPLDFSLSTIYTTVTQQCLLYCCILGTVQYSSQALITGRTNSSTITKDTTFIMLNQDTYQAVYQYFVIHIYPLMKTLPGLSETTKLIENFTTQENTYYSLYETTIGQNMEEYPEALVWYTSLCTYTNKYLTLYYYNESKLTLLWGKQTSLSHSMAMMNTTDTINTPFPFNNKYYSVFYWWNTLLSNQYTMSSINNNSHVSKILSLGAFTLFLLTGTYNKGASSTTTNAGSSRTSIVTPSSRNSIASNSSRMSIAPSTSIPLSGFATGATNNNSTTTMPRLSVAPNALVPPPTPSTLIPRQSIAPNTSTGLGSSIPRASVGPSTMTSTNKEGSVEPNRMSIIQTTITTNKVAVVPPSLPTSRLSMAGTTPNTIPSTTPVPLVSTAPPPEVTTSATSNVSKPPVTTRATRTALANKTNTAPNANANDKESKDPSKFFKSLLEKPVTTATMGTKGTTK